MVRLRDLPDHERDHLLSKNSPPLGPPAWVAPTKPLSAQRVALLTTAGLHFRDDATFGLADASFRALPGEADPAELVTSHSSANFDRTGFQDDVNVVFPLDRFRELERDGVIGSLADVHYSFMGAGLEPDAYEASVGTVAASLARDRVDSVFLTPV
jgi:D-proline reductase (dithiol) PrdB